MPRKSKQPGEYEVGYGKPPRHTRFKPGQSGNPKGRTKGTLNIRTVIEEALRKEFLQPITVIEGGKSIKITKIELLIKTNVNKAAGGDPRSVRELVALVHRFGLNEVEQPAVVAAEPQQFAADDQAIIDRFLARERVGSLPQTTEEEDAA